LSIAPRLFRWHRWLGYVVGAQLLLWVCGGMVFAWLPFKSWVKAEDRVGRPQATLPADWAQRLSTADIGSAPILAVSSVVTSGGPAFRLRGASGERWLAADGKELAPPDAAAIERFARSLYRGSGAYVGAEKIDRVEPRLGIVREVGPGRALWRARFDDPLATRLYFDARSGEFLLARTEAWVWYDLFWRLHVMDYDQGEDVNNALLRGAALLALAMVATGLILLALALRRTWRVRRARRHTVVPSK
jgi:uncharacterized iron-regulated membrane protein